jgi:hypothetical protein
VMNELELVMNELELGSGSLELGSFTTLTTIGHNSIHQRSPKLSLFVI